MLSNVLVWYWRTLSNRIRSTNAIHVLSNMGRETIHRKLANNRLVCTVHAPFRQFSAIFYAHICCSYLLICLCAIAQMRTRILITVAFAFALLSAACLFSFIIVRCICTSMPLELFSNRDHVQVMYTLSSCCAVMTLYWGVLPYEYMAMQL